MGAWSIRQPRRPSQSGFGGGGESAVYINRHGGLRKVEVFKDLICVTVRSEINRCREDIKKATEMLNEEKIRLESKVD